MELVTHMNPVGTQIELLPHQIEGAAALFGQGKSKSVLIADEPRVGKTFTAITLEQLWRNKAVKSGGLSGGGRTLVISVTEYDRIAL
jgi:hypothetical protein